MYKKDLNHKITVRLTDAQNDGLTKMAEFYGLTPSDMVRQLITTNINTHNVMMSSLSGTVDGVVKELAEATKTEKKVASSDKKAKTAVSSDKPKSKSTSKSKK